MRSVPIYSVIDTSKKKAARQKLKQVQGFQKKDALFSKMKNIPNLLRDDRERKMIDFHILAIGRPLYNNFGKLAKRPAKRNHAWW